jgi:hypothetical protein
VIANGFGRHLHIFALLFLANALMSAALQNKWMQAGADAEIVKISAAIMRKTAARYGYHGEGRCYVPQGS